MTEARWRAVFVAAAVFNWLTGLSLLFDAGPIAASAGIELARYDTLYSPFVGWLVIVFGTLYYIVSRDVSKNHGAVLGGALAKTGMFVLVWLAVLRGEAPIAMGTLVVAHLLFALAFAVFLLQRARPAR
jgi:hypothetical protein